MRILLIFSQLSFCPYMGFYLIDDVQNFLNNSRLYVVVVSEAYITGTPKGNRQGWNVQLTIPKQRTYIR